MMDEVRIWNTARTQTEIQNNMNGEIDPSASGLALYYTFNQGIAGGTNTGLTTVVDQAGTNNGTLTNFSLSGSTSNFLTQNNNMFILPLKWLSFTAQKQNETVLLKWSTASETNTNNFTIEHSANGKDWNTIGSILSNNANITYNYSYVDVAPTPGINYYRIRENDNDGKYSYTKIGSINFSEDEKPFKLISNPIANNTLQFEINSTSSQIICLIGNDGKILWRKKFIHGLHSINLNTLPKGVYFLKSANSTEKILLQ
jgi:hypothetical protein